MLPQVFETSLVDDAALMKDVDVVEANEQVEPVHRRNDGLIRKGIKQLIVDQRFRTGVHAARRFVQQYQVAVTGGASRCF
jgi:hypothetical protein